MIIYNAAVKSRPLDLEGNFGRALLRLEEAAGKGAGLAVFPARFLTGADIGLMEGKKYFEETYNGYMKKLSARRKDILIAADRYRRREGFSPAFYLGGRQAGDDSAALRGLKIRLIQSEKALAGYGGGDDLVLFCATEPVIAGKRKLLRAFLGRLADRSGATVAANLGGLGRTSHPFVYMPASGVFYPGAGGSLTKDAREYIKAGRFFEIGEKKPARPGVALPPLDFETVYSKNPLIPARVGEEEYCLDLFRLQTAALAARLDNLNMKRAVVALSGGLDSALALLVTVNAFDSLGLDRSGIEVISMPGFGTSGTTRGLSARLAESLGFKLRTIDITAACRQALTDIGHDARTPDVTFENVQARMRTLNALNIANRAGGIMVGTGDLSEEALGFSTYGGDRLAGYNVNSSVAKTVIRTMLPYITKLSGLAAAARPIEKILKIPVSPELVPHGGEILQKTEEILAPYKLVDFYTYCLVCAGISPARMVKKAREVFGDEFSPEYLVQKADMYCRRFISGQFKRSRAPEGAILTHARLAGNVRLPSDRSMSLFDVCLGEISGN